MLEDEPYPSLEPQVVHWSHSGAVPEVLGLSAYLSKSNSVPPAPDHLKELPNSVTLNLTLTSGEAIVAPPARSCITCPCEEKAWSKGTGNGNISPDAHAN